MVRFAIFTLFAAYIAYKVLPPIQEKNALVLVETQGLYIDKLSGVSGLKAAFRVLKNFDDSILDVEKKSVVEKRVDTINQQPFANYH